MAIAGTFFKRGGKALLEPKVKDTGQQKHFSEK